MTLWDRKGKNQKCSSDGRQEVQEPKRPAPCAELAQVSRFHKHPKVHRHTRVKHVAGLGLREEQGLEGKEGGR